MEKEHEESVTTECENGHKMTGIGFSECPDCEAPWKTPQVEEWEKQWEVFEFNHLQSPVGNSELNFKIYSFISSLLTSREQQAYERGVKDGERYQKMSNDINNSKVH